MVQIRRTHEINPSFHLRSSQTIRPSKWESQRLWTIISPNVFHMKMTFKAGWVWLTGPIKSQNLSLVSFRAHLIAVSVDDRWGKAGSWWSWIITVNQKLYKSSDKLLRLNQQYSKSWCKRQKNIWFVFTDAAASNITWIHVSYRWAKETPEIISFMIIQHTTLILFLQLCLQAGNPV